VPKGQTGWMRRLPGTATVLDLIPSNSSLIGNPIAGLCRFYLTGLRVAGHPKPDALGSTMLRERRALPTA